MHTFFLLSAIVLTIIIAVPLVRVLKGPTVFDRLLATNAIATKTIVLICIIGYLYGRIDMFIDITLAYAILGFVGSLVIAKYVISSKVVRD
ncbi:MAG: pH regulation protein F [Bacteroidetes bacterium]|jgi:multicomponent Na+:H+ antiporter subunit F|uniref:Monovalent cation/H+ antiporter complex subunit F n=1 Tax=Rhodohalobacter sulfatireducens TaxID=2911366 RepID=A0ABS9KBU3_9BACT|nr:monovalent cation/H+ antiporter complex subunit F [Rhodohalobacter sulfatireducens]MCG2588303.1 monovalent cation/H+ antiporter complex subunit F [Rhodohalobacter sulfatireducens]NBC66153.1 pH regulation protein F [Bacteroidota bacterium]